MFENIVSQSDYDKICRTCLKSDYNMLPLYSEDILKMLSVCTTLIVNENDGFPSQICSDCFRKASESYSFNLQCEQSDKILKQSIDHSAVEDVKIKYEVISEEHDNHDHFVAPNIDSCEDVKYSPSFNESINFIKEEHFLIDNPKTEAVTPWEKALQLGPEKCDPVTRTCNICNKVLSDVYYLVRHMETHDENRKFTTNCPICGKGFYNTKYMKKHLSRHTSEKKHRCDHCNLTFTDIRRLKRHYEFKHFENKLSCNQCNAQFYLQLELDKHICSNPLEEKCTSNRSKRPIKRKVKEEISLTCRICEKIFSNEKSSRQHYKRMHSGKRKAKVCTICGKSVIHLTSHMEIHSNVRHKCADCGKDFSDKYGLRKHRKRTHSDLDDSQLNPYLCNICGKSTNSQRNLDRHLLVHTDEAPYKCTLCDKSFKTNYQCKAHVKHFHNDIRNYQCSVCSKCFHTQAALSIHNRGHTGEKPYRCKICGKTGHQRSTLRVHMRVHGLHTKDSLDEISRNIEVNLPRYKIKERRIKAKTDNIKKKTPDTK